MTTPDADVLLGWALLAVLNAADLRGVPTGQGSEVAAGETSVSAQVAQSVAEGFPRLMNGSARTDGQLNSPEPGPVVVRPEGRLTALPPLVRLIFAVNVVGVAEFKVEGIVLESVE